MNHICVMLNIVMVNNIIDIGAIITNEYPGNNISYWILIVMTITAKVITIAIFIVMTKLHYKIVFKVNWKFIVMTKLT